MTFDWKDIGKHLTYYLQFNNYKNGRGEIQTLILGMEKIPTPLCPTWIFLILKRWQNDRFYSHNYPSTFCFISTSLMFKPPHCKWQNTQTCPKPDLPCTSIPCFKEKEGNDGVSDYISLHFHPNLTSPNK